VQVTTPDNVETDLGWALFAVLRGYRQATDAALAGLPGGPRGYQVLAASQRGEAASQLALAQQLGVDRTVMTYLLDDLERAGLVERKPDPADRRTRRVTLTEAGNAAMCDSHRRLRAVEDELLEPLLPAEREALRGMLYRLATRTDATQPVTCTEAERLTEPVVVQPR
jgi:DNA-binding MarR family transcriptional regulator